MTTVAELEPKAALSIPTLALREELADGSMKRVARFQLGDLEAEVCQGRDAVWCIVRRPGAGGLALRTAFLGGTRFKVREVAASPGEDLRLEVDSALGRHSICFSATETELHRLRAVTRFTPAVEMRPPDAARDLFALDPSDDPTKALGSVKAVQRGCTSGLVYFCFVEPDFGSVLYFQNLTPLNPYFLATGTTPEEVVGGDWPELGLKLPTPENQEVEHRGMLAAGEEYVLSDAIVVLRDWAADTEQEMARQFLQMLGTVYTALELPDVEYRDWVGRAEDTLRDLESADQARTTEFGDLYLMPYPDGEYPDVMVQLSVIQALHEYGAWLGQPVPLEAQLMQGIRRFYDAKLKTLRRYLPNVGEKQGKDRDAVDSWYLYHPMLNLGRLALDGNDEARDLLLKSVDYGIKAAHHFAYEWPIMYKIGDFSIITETREGGLLGQTDVGGIYAYVMLQCFELTGEDRFIHEAAAAIDKAKGLRFDLLYQSNLTVWGAVACLRLWRVTDDRSYLDQSYAYLASFFYNTTIWQSRIGTAKDFDHFLGVICLHDAPYMAMYECFESFAGLDDYLAQAGTDLEPAVRMLVSEYCRYTLHRAVYYYPDMLPKDDIHSGEHQSGVVNPKLCFPLEDLYPDGQPAGQVGQEIYGAGGAFVFATRSHHRIEDAPFMLYCDHIVRSFERTGRTALSISLDGGETCTAKLAVVRLKRRKLTKTTVVTPGGDIIRPYQASDDRIEFHVPAAGRVILRWE